MDKIILIIPWLAGRLPADGGRVAAGWNVKYFVIVHIVFTLTTDTNLSLLITSPGFHLARSGPARARTKH